MKPLRLAAFLLIATAVVSHAQSARAHCIGATLAPQTGQLAVLESRLTYSSRNADPNTAGLRCSSASEFANLIVSDECETGAAVCDTRRSARLVVSGPLWAADLAHLVSCHLDHPLDDTIAVEVVSAMTEDGKSVEQSSFDTVTAAAVSAAHIPRKARDRAHHDTIVSRNTASQV